MYETKGENAQNEWTPTQAALLPPELRGLPAAVERMAQAAHAYRREAIAIRAALHDLCKDNANMLRFHDMVIRHSREMFAELEQGDNAKVRKLRDQVRRRVVAAAVKMGKWGHK